VAKVVEVVLPERYVRLDDGRLGHITNLIDRQGRETTCLFDAVSGVAQACDRYGRQIEDEWHAFEIHPAERAQ
jgi:hypothetical protein